MNRHARLAALLVLVVVGVVFSDGFGGGYVWDDKSLLLGDSAIRGEQDLLRLVTTPFWGSAHQAAGVSPLYRTVYRPLIKLYLNLGSRGFGAGTTGFHVVSWLFHLATTALTIGFLRARPRREGTSFLGPVLIALLCALHPTKVETVAWVSGIPDLAMTFFVLLGVVASTGPAAPWRSWVAVLAFAMAGWCKETALLVPFLVAFDAWAEDAPGATLRRRVGLALAPSALVFASWLAAIRGLPATLVDPSGGSGIGAFARIVGSVGAFVERGFWPVPATLFPGGFGNDPRGAPMVPIHFVVAGCVVLATTLGTALVAIRRPRLRGIAADLLWFVVPLVPVSNFVLRTGASLISDRFLFLPMLGIGALALRMADAAVARALVRPPVAVAAASAMAAVFAVETSSSIGRFADQRTLFEHEVRVRPDVPAGAEELIAELEVEGEFERASDVALQAARRFSGGRSPTFEGKFALDHLRMVVITTPEHAQDRLISYRDSIDRFADSGMLSFATPDVRYERRFRPAARAAIGDDPKRFLVLHALVHAKTLDFEGAERIARNILLRSPGQVGAAILGATASAQRGDFDGGLRLLEGARRHVGADPRLAAADELIRTTRTLASTVLADPREAAVRDANVGLRLGSPERARRLLRPVLDADPAYTPAVLASAFAEDADGRHDAAIAVLDAAIARTADPVLVDVRSRFAVRRAAP